MQSSGPALRVAAVLALGVLFASLLQGQDAPPNPKPDATVEKFNTDLSTVKGVGLVEGKQRVIHLHIEEGESDTFLAPWFNRDTLFTPYPIWDFKKDAARLDITHPLDARLRGRQPRLVRESKLFDKEGLGHSTRLIVTHRIRYIKGIRRRDDALKQLLNRWLFRVSALPETLDLVNLTGGPRYGVPSRKVPPNGKVRFLEKLSVLAVKPDGTLRLRYDDDVFDLPPGKSWPAPVQGRTVPVAEIAKVVWWGRAKGPDDKDIAYKRQMQKRVFGDQAGIRFTTELSIINRGIVTVQARPRKEAGK